MDKSAGPLDLQSSSVIVNQDLLADTITVTDTIWSDLGQRYRDFAGHTLIATLHFDDDWPTWQIRPHSDEVVCLMSGDADMILATNDGEKKVRLDSPGLFVTVPRNTWHTAKVHAPTTMSFITPGKGTENRESPGKP